MSSTRVRTTARSMARAMKNHNDRGRHERSSARFAHAADTRLTDQRIVLVRPARAGGRYLINPLAVLIVPRSPRTPPCRSFET